MKWFILFSILCNNNNNNTLCFVYALKFFWNVCKLNTVAFFLCLMTLKSNDKLYCTDLHYAIALWYKIICVACFPLPDILLFCGTAFQIPDLFFIVKKQYPEHILWWGKLYCFLIQFYVIIYIHKYIQIYIMCSFVYLIYCLPVS